MTEKLAIGTNSDFRYTTTTTASREQIWHLWTSVDSWGQWDGGLKSASIEGEFKEGAKGQLIDLSDRKSSFTITEYEPNVRYTFETDLPLAKLSVSHFFEENDSGQTIFTHHVRFTGAFGWFFASILGKGFRAELPLTMERLVRLAEESAES